jgi:hypothetical protein
MALSLNTTPRYHRVAIGLAWRMGYTHYLPCINAHLRSQGEQMSDGACRASSLDGESVQCLVSNFEKCV